MPTLPLDHPEPFAATLGVMLYPATDEIDPPKARAFAAQWVAEQPYRLFHEAGHRLPEDVVARLLVDAGQRLTDLEERLWGGLATGDLFKTFFALAENDPALASWENAIRIYDVAPSAPGPAGAVRNCGEREVGF
jgi:hypothetical protein